MNFYAVSFQLVSSVAVGLVTAYGRTLKTSDKDDCACIYAGQVIKIILFRRIKHNLNFFSEVQASLYNPQAIYDDNNMIVENHLTPVNDTLFFKNGTYLYCNYSELRSQYLT